MHGQFDTNSNAREEAILLWHSLLFYFLDDHAALFIPKRDAVDPDPDITILYELSRLFGVTMEALLTGAPDAAEENMQSSIPTADDGNAGTVPSAQESAPL
ncbi:MAG: hypothetical protein IJE08_07900 [Clostridia bacterium]|nr:hypothetical protein [Clostridia bacterium]